MNPNPNPSKKRKIDLSDEIVDELHPHPNSSKRRKIETRIQHLNSDSFFMILDHLYDLDQRTLASLYTSLDDTILKNFMAVYVRQKFVPNETFRLTEEMFEGRQWTMIPYEEIIRENCIKLKIKQKPQPQNFSQVRKTYQHKSLNLVFKFLCDSPRFFENITTLIIKTNKYLDQTDIFTIFKYVYMTPSICEVYLNLPLCYHKNYFSMSERIWRWMEKPDWKEELQDMVNRFVTDKRQITVFYQRNINYAEYAGYAELFLEFNDQQEFVTFKSIN